MRVKTVKSRHGSISYSIIRDIKKPDGTRSTEVVVNLGNHTQLQEKCPDMDPMDYARQIAKEMTEAEKKGQVTLVQKYDMTRLTSLNQHNGHDIGYFFLDQLFYQLKLDKVCDNIKKQTKVTFDLTEILKTLISTRILYPSSKRSSHALSQHYFTPPQMELHHVYRALDVLAEQSEAIQTAVYKQSCELVERNTHVLYYDCTNFFFEIEEEDDFRRYGRSKEHRPNPIVQMGLFLDGSGLPLAFTIFPGNQNEQPSLKPLEKRIIKDFQLSNLVICTDAGLSSAANRRFNTTKTRRFVTTQSIKKMKKSLKDWALDRSGWKLAHLSPNHPDYGKEFHLDEIDQMDASKMYYKERWELAEITKEERALHIKPFEERYVVTYSAKYQTYQETIRHRQVERATRKIHQRDPLKTRHPQSPSRFIKRTSVTKQGEQATDYYSINESVIEEEARYDGFYCIATNLEGPVEDILSINHQRFDIEKAFSELKGEFKSRPVYLSREERIQAHFLVCFLALTIFRILQHQLASHESIETIIRTLREMKVTRLDHAHFIPHYTRTLMTDKLHEHAGFRTDYELIPKKALKKIEKNIRNRK